MVKRIRKQLPLFGVCGGWIIGPFYILFWDVVTEAYTLVDIHQTEHFKPVNFIVCKLYNKEVKKQIRKITGSSKKKAKVL